MALIPRTEGDDLDARAARRAAAQRRMELERWRRPPPPQVQQAQQPPEPEPVVARVFIPQMQTPAPQPLTPTPEELDYWRERQEGFYPLEIGLMRDARPRTRYPQPAPAPMPVVVTPEAEEPQPLDLGDFVRLEQPPSPTHGMSAYQAEQTTEARQDGPLRPRYNGTEPVPLPPNRGFGAPNWRDFVPDVTHWRNRPVARYPEVDPESAPPNDDPMSMPWGMGMPVDDAVFSGDDEAVAQTNAWRPLAARARQAEQTVLARQDEGAWAPQPPGEVLSVPGEELTGRGALDFELARAQEKAQQAEETTATRQDDAPPAQPEPVLFDLPATLAPAADAFEALPATQWVQQRTEDRAARVDDPNYFTWAGDNPWLRNAGLRTSNFFDWTFGWPQKALSGIPFGEVDLETGQVWPTVEAAGPQAQTETITLGQLLGVLGGAINKSVNPFLPHMRGSPSALTVSEMAGTDRGGPNDDLPTGAAAALEWATLGNWVNQELARIGRVSQKIASLPPEHTHSGNLAIMEGTSGARRMEGVLEELVAKDNVADLYMQADKALQAGDVRLARQLFAQAASLDNATYTDIWDKWSNPWAEVVEGVLADPTSIVLDPLFGWVGAAIAARRGMRLARSGVEEVAYLAARREGEQLAEAIRHGQQVQTGGFSPFDNLWLIGRTDDAKAHVDADIVFGGLARVLQGVTTTQDAKTLLHSYIKQPNRFLAGVGGLAGNYFSKIADATGNVRFGAASVANKELVERSWLLSLVGDGIDDMRALQGDNLNVTELMAELDTLIYRSARLRYGLSALDEIPAGAASFRTVTLPNGKSAVEYLDKAGKTIANSTAMTPRQAEEYVKALSKALKGQSESPLMGALRSMDRVQRALMSDMWLNLRPGHWMRNAMSATATLMADDLYTLRPIGEVLDDLATKTPGAPTRRTLEATVGVGRTLGAAAESLGTEKHWSRIGPLDSPANIYAGANEAANRIWTGMTQILGTVPFGEQAFYVRAFDKGFQRTFRNVWGSMVKESLYPALVQAGMDQQAAANVAQAIVSAGITGNKQTVAERAAQMAQELATTFDLSELRIPHELFPLPVWRELNDALIGWQVNGRGASLQEMQQQVRTIIQRAKHHYAEILRDAPVQVQTQFTLQGIGEEMAALVDEVLDDARAAGAPLDEQSALGVRQAVQEIGQQQEANTQAVIDEIARASVPENAQVAQMQVAMDTWQGIQDVRNRARAAVDEASNQALASGGEAWDRKWAETHRIYRESLQEEAAVVEQARRDLQTLIGGGDVQPRYDAWENIQRYVEYDLDEISRARAFEPSSTAVQRERWQALIGAQRKYVDMSRAEMVRAFNVFASPDAFDLLVQADKRLNLRGAAAAAYLTPLRNQALEAKNPAVWQRYFGVRNQIWKDWADAAVTDYRNSGRMMLWMGIADRNKAEIRWVDARTGGDFVLEWEEESGKWAARDMRDGSRHTVGEGTGIDVPPEIQRSWRELYKRATENAEREWQGIIEQTLRRGRRDTPSAPVETAAPAPAVRELTPGVDFTEADRAIPRGAQTREVLNPGVDYRTTAEGDVDFFEGPMSRTEFERQLGEAFHLTDDERSASMALYDAHAEQWARYTRREAGKWYEARIQRVTSGEPAGAAAREGARGAVQFADDGRAIIYAMERGDVSTVVHEGMHVWVRELQELALEHETAAADLSVLEVWAKVVDGTWTAEAHELVARAGERYLLEGKAPTENLVTVFEKFRAWLGSIYRKAKRNFKGDPKLTPEVRGVMDRLFAAGDEGTAAVDEVAPVTPPTLDAPATTPAALEAIERRIEDIGEETARITQAVESGDIAAAQGDEAIAALAQEADELGEAYAVSRLAQEGNTRRTVDEGDWRDVGFQKLAGDDAGRERVKWSELQVGDVFWHANESWRVTGVDAKGVDFTAIDDPSGWNGRTVFVDGADERSVGLISRSATDTMSSVASNPADEVAEVAAESSPLDALQTQLEEARAEVRRLIDERDAAAQGATTSAARGRIAKQFQEAVDGATNRVLELEREMGRLVDTLPGEGLQGLRVGDTFVQEGRSLRLERVEPSPLYGPVVIARDITDDLSTELNVTKRLPVDAFEQITGSRLSQEALDVGLPDTATGRADAAQAEAADDARGIDAGDRDPLARILAEEDAGTAGGGRGSAVQADRSVEGEPGAGLLGEGDSTGAAPGRELGDSAARLSGPVSGRSDGGVAGSRAEDGTRRREPGELVSESVGGAPGDGAGSALSRGLPDAGQADAGVAEGVAATPGGADAGGATTAVSGTDARLVLGSADHDAGTGRGAVEAGEGVRGTVRPGEPAARITPPAASAANDLVITNDLAEEISRVGGVKTRYSRNRDAISLLKRLEGEGRLATPEEQRILARYSGFGDSGLRQGLFGSDMGNVSARMQAEWASEVEEMRKLLTPEEWDAARRSTLNAHYTSPEVVRGMWQALERMGIGNIARPRVLEPAIGIGHFFGLMPSELAGRASRVGVDLDSLSARIAGQLYQNAKVIESGFEVAPLADNAFDLSITNVPFWEGGVNDIAYKGKPRFLTKPLHNYYFAKQLDKVAPGGVVAAITSHHTLDAVTAEGFRRFLSEQAELLGAIRLPRTAFAENAGTEVVTDIIFLRKRAAGDVLAEEPAWVKSASTEVGGSGKTVSLNQYFLDNPEMVIGRHSDTGKMYRAAEYTVELDDVGEFSGRFQAALRRLPENVLSEQSARAETAVLDQAARVRNETLRVHQGKVQRASNGVWHDVKATANEADRIQGMTQLSNAAQDALRAQRVGDEAEIQSARATLNGVYDDFVKRYGSPNSRQNRALFGDDPNAALVGALEVKEGKNWRKADIFSKTVVRPDVTPTRADRVQDAMLISLRQRNRVDMEYMQQLTGKTEQQIADELGDELYRNPYGGWEEKGAYLSGNVREKLQQAEQAALVDPQYRRNVDALRAVQPEDMDASRIGIVLGQGWIPIDDYNAFANHLFGGNRWKLNHTPTLNLWRWSERPTASYLFSETALENWSTARMKGPEILEQTLAGKAIQIFDTVKNDMGGTDRILNASETKAVQRVQERMQTEFAQWIWEDPDRAEKVHRLYNDTFNVYVPRKYDGSHLTLPGSSPDLTLRSTQKDAVWRALQSGNTLFAHEVGTGKTLVMSATAMEMRRLGLAHKPMIIFPASVKGSFPQQFKSLYPWAKVLTPDDIEMGAAGRARTLQRVATGDWDAVLLTQQQFSQIPISERMAANYLQEELDHLLAIKKEAGQSRSAAKDPTVRYIESEIAKLQQRIQKIRESAGEKGALTWEELGVDALFVDEADNYKNLPIQTVRRNISGLGDGEGSIRAQHMYMTTAELNKRMGGRNVFFATGTPISNSVTELYSLQRYLMPDALRKMDLWHYDAWHTQYIATGQIVKNKPTGDVMREAVTGIQNAPMLRRWLGEIMDVVQQGDVPDFKAPARVNEVVSLPESLEIRTVRQWMKDQLKAIEQAPKRRWVTPNGTLIELNIYNNSRLASLDMRLLDPALGDSPTSKTNAAVRKVLEFYHRPDVQQMKGTQLMFVDFGSPGGVQFDLYNDIKGKLVAGGIPESEIAFIQNFQSEAQKNVLQLRMNAGEIRVLIGGDGMRAGLNVQERAYAVHHLTFGWRPRDMIQADGRVFRDKNNWETAYSVRYAQQPTDSVVLDLVDTKFKTFGRFVSGDVDDFMEAVDADPYEIAHFAAEASGNPLGRRSVQLGAELDRMEAAQKSFVNQRVRWKREAVNATNEAEAYDALLPALRSDVALRDANTDPSTLVLFGDTIAERKLQQQALQKALNQIVQDGLTREREIGIYRGFDLVVVPSNARQTPWTLELRAQRTYAVTMTEHNAQILNAVDKRLDDLNVGATEVIRDQLRARAKEMQTLTTREFGEAERLRTVQAEYADVQQQLLEYMDSLKSVDEKAGTASLDPLLPIYDRVSAARRQDAVTGGARTIDGTATRGDASDILYQGPAEGYRNRDWFGFMRSDNPAQTLWEHTSRWLRKRPTPTVSDVAAHQIETMEQAERAILNALPGMQGQRRGAMSAPQVAALRAGIDKLLPRFDDAVYSATTMAQRGSDFAMLNFKDRRHFDALLSIIFPYHFFWSRSAKNWAFRALRKPGVVNAYYETQRGIAAENLQAGVPNRLRGTIPLYTREDGTQVRIANPLNYALPFNMYWPGSFAGEEPDLAAEKWLQTIQRWTPGFMPLLQVLSSAWLDKQDPLPNGEKRTDAYFAGGYVPQWGLLGMANAALGGRVLRGSADQWQTYRVTRAIPIIAQREGLDPILAGYAQQIALNVRDNKGIYEKVPKEHQAAAWTLYERGRTEAARDRIAATGGSYFTGVNAYPWRPEEKLLTDASRQYGFAGYDPRTNPAGSKAAQREVLAQYPMLSAWWNRTAGAPAQDPMQPTPGDRAATSEFFDQRQRIFDRQANAIIHYFATHPQPDAAELRELKARFGKEIEALNEKYEDVPKGEGTTRGMNLTERALHEIEKVLGYKPGPYPTHPGDDATPEQLQAYYGAVAEWEVARLTRVDAMLRQMMETPEHYQPWYGEMQRLLQGQYTGRMLLDQEYEHMTAVERAWQEQRHFEQEIRDADWQKKRGTVEAQLGSAGVAAFDRYMNTPAGEARTALRQSNPIFGAAVEAAYNPEEYAAAVALFGEHWYTVATGGPQHPGDKASEAQLQSYYDALDAYKAQHPEYDAVRMWWNGRPNARPAGFARDYGKDYQTALTLFGEDIFAQVLARQQAYAQSRESGFAWQDANAAAYKRVMAYNAWRSEEVDLSATYLPMVSGAPAQDVASYQGPRPVGSEMPPLGSDPTYRYAPQGPPPSAPVAAAGTAAPQTASVAAQGAPQQAQPGAAVSAPTQTPTAPGTGVLAPWMGGENPATGDPDAINRYAGQNTTYTKNQAQAATWAQRKQGVYETFGAEAGRLYETYLSLPKGEERTAFRAANPIMRAISLYTWQPELFDQGTQQFGQEAVVAWANAPVWDGTPEAEEVRRMYWNDNPQAWLFNAWLNGRPQDYDEGDLGADDDAFQYNGGADYAEAMRQFGEDIWALAIQYRLSGTEERRALRQQFQQLMPFFDWWYGQLPSQAPAVYRSADGLVTYNQRGQRLDSHGNVAFGWHPSGGRGSGGGRAPQVRMPEVRAAHMNPQMWQTGSDRPWTPTGYGSSWREAGAALRPPDLRTWRRPEASRPADLPRASRPAELPRRQYPRDLPRVERY